MIATELSQPYLVRRDPPQMRRRPGIHVVLAAHGSRDPRSAATVRALTAAVATARPDLIVHDAYLEFNAPRLGDVLAGLAHRSAAPIVVVPLLLSAAFHARTDIPAIVAAARNRGARVEIADVLSDPEDGGAALLVAALQRRLHESGGRPDAVVLAAAGTRDADALAGIDSVAAALGRAEGVPCVAGYASGAGRPIAEAIAHLQAAGAHDVGIAGYFLAPGRLYDRIVTAGAAATGRPAVAQPLGTAAEIVAIASLRIDYSLSRLSALV